MENQENNNKRPILAKNNLPQAIEKASFNNLPQELINGNELQNFLDTHQLQVFKACNKIEFKKDNKIVETLDLYHGVAEEDYKKLTATSSTSQISRNARLSMFINESLSKELNTKEREARLNGTLEEWKQHHDEITIFFTFDYLVDKGIYASLSAVERNFEKDFIFYQYFLIKQHEIETDTKTFFQLLTLEYSKKAKYIKLSLNKRAEKYYRSYGANTTIYTLLSTQKGNEIAHYISRLVNIQAKQREALFNDNNEHGFKLSLFAIAQDLDLLKVDYINEDGVQKTYRVNEEKQLDYFTKLLKENGKKDIYSLIKEPIIKGIKDINKTEQNEIKIYYLKYSGKFEEFDGKKYGIIDSKSFDEKTQTNEDGKKPIHLKEWLHCKVKVVIGGDFYKDIEKNLNEQNERFYEEKNAASEQTIQQNEIKKDANGKYIINDDDIAF